MARGAPRGSSGWVTAGHPRSRDAGPVQCRRRAASPGRLREGLTGGADGHDRHRRASEVRTAFPASAATLAGRAGAPPSASIEAIRGQARDAGDHGIWLLADALADAEAATAVLTGVEDAELPTT